MMMAHGSFTKIHDSFTKKLHKTFMKASTKQERLTQAQPEKKRIDLHARRCGSFFLGMSKVSPFHATFMKPFVLPTTFFSRTAMQACALCLTSAHARLIRKDAPSQWMPQLARHPAWQCARWVGARVQSVDDRSFFFSFAQ